MPCQVDAAVAQRRTLARGSGVYVQKVGPGGQVYLLGRSAQIIQAVETIRNFDKCETSDKSEARLETRKRRRDPEVATGTSLRPSVFARMGQRKGDAGSGRSAGGTPSEKG